jgi:hypothetical protein
MTNLLEETLDDLKEHKLQQKNIVWVGSRDGKYVVSWSAFKTIAKNTEYYAGYGSQEIASDLVIVFRDGSWLERYEYDGSEGWEYKIQPQQQDNALPFDKVKGEDYSPTVHKVMTGKYNDDEE